MRHGPGGDLGPRAEVELRQDVLQVAARRPLGDDQRVGDLAVRQPAGDERGHLTLAGRERLRAKLSYTNVGFALAPETFTISQLRELYAAALGHPVSTTNLQRVLLRRGLLEATGERREPGPTGGRPAAVFRFRSRRLEITDQSAVLRPPELRAS